MNSNGESTADKTSAADVEAFEALEMAQDVAAYRDARAADDGVRVTLDELRAALGDSSTAR